MHRIATEYLAAGLAVLPATRADKYPYHNDTYLPWKGFQRHLPTPEHLAEWFAVPPTAIGIVAGAVSGNVEVIDFDCAGVLFNAWQAAIAPALFARLTVESTQSGGYHVVYRCPAGIDGNMKLAQRLHTVTPDDVVETAGGAESVILYGKGHKVRVQPDGTRTALLTPIETRGDGGFFVCSPTPGYELVHGSLTELPVLTAAERDELLTAAWNLNEVAVAADTPQSTTLSSARPGDDYSARGDVRAVLQRHGWQLVRGGANEFWRRPGKHHSWSATLKDRVFYVFSSNAWPFESNRGYGPFQVYALLEHNGDFAAAARALAALGYGSGPDSTPAAIVDVTGVMTAPSIDDATQGQPEVYRLSELLVGWPVEAEPVIDGWLRRGEVANLIGGPKTYKTWLLQQIIVHVLTGAPVFGYGTLQGRVLLIDYELARPTLAKRIYNVAHALGSSVRDIDRHLTLLPMRGKQFDLAAVERFVRADEYDLICIDPLFRLFGAGMDENSNVDIAALYGRLIGLAERANAGLIVVHHTSKGNQSEKQVTDIGAGAGSQSRATDLHLTLRAHEQEGCAVVAGVVRSFRPFEPFVIRYDWPVWTEAPELDPCDLASARKKSDGKADRKKMTAAEFAVRYCGTPRSRAAILELASNDVSVYEARQLFTAAMDLELLKSDVNEADKRRNIYVVNNETVNENEA